MKFLPSRQPTRDVSPGHQVIPTRPRAQLEGGANRPPPDLATMLRRVSAASRQSAGAWCRSGPKTSKPTSPTTLIRRSGPAPAARRAGRAIRRIFGRSASSNFARIYARIFRTAYFHICPFATQIRGAGFCKEINASVKRSQILPKVFQGISSLISQYNQKILWMFRQCARQILFYGVLKICF